MNVPALISAHPGLSCQWAITSSIFQYYPHCPQELVRLSPMAVRPDMDHPGHARVETEDIPNATLSYSLHALTLTLSLSHSHSADHTYTPTTHSHAHRQSHSEFDVLAKAGSEARKWYSSICLPVTKCFINRHFTLVGSHFCTS